MFLGEINWMNLKLNKYQVLFLDFDGVVVETDDLHKKIIISLLKKEGINITSTYYDKELLGKVTYEIFKSCLPNFSSNSIKKLVEIKRRDYCILANKIDRNMRNHISELILDFNQNRKPIYIVSSSSVEEIEIWLKKWNNQHLFSTIITADMVLKGKPNPDIYYHALDICKNNPIDVIAIEDSDNGCIAAETAGIDVYKYSI